MSETLKTNPETSKTEKTTEWDDLANLNESWEEHLIMAKAYLEEPKNIAEAPKDVEETEAPENVSELDQATIATLRQIDSNHSLRGSRKEFYQNLAEQEKIERELNSNLTHVEDIELLAETGDSRIERKNVKFRGQEIPVYVLKNYPIKFLAHIINYREGDNISEIGINTADGLMNDPRKWDEPYRPPRPEEVNAGGWIIDKHNAKSNTLSTSYINLSTLQNYENGLAAGHGNLDTRIIYGFDRVRPTSIFSATSVDNRTPNYKKQGDGYHNRGFDKFETGIMDNLNRDDTEYHGGYNEFAMFRYDEQGKPLEPSFMITQNKRILLDTENEPEETIVDIGVKNVAKRNENFYMNRIKEHALYHQIPIILIERNSYGDETKPNLDEYLNNNLLEAITSGIRPDKVSPTAMSEMLGIKYGMALGSDDLKKFLNNGGDETMVLDLAKQAGGDRMVDSARLAIGEVKKTE